MKIILLATTILSVIIFSKGVFSQEYLGEYQIKSIGDNFCLDYNQNDKVIGTWRDCHGRKNQRWNIFKMRGNKKIYTITSSLDNKCVDIAGGSSTNGAKVIPWDCSGEDNQKFRINNVGITPDLQTINTIKGIGSKKCIDVDQRNRGNGKNILLWDCHGKQNQQFVLTPIFETKNARLPSTNNRNRGGRDNFGRGRGGHGGHGGHGGGHELVCDTARVNGQYGLKDLKNGKGITIQASMNDYDCVFAKNSRVGRYTCLSNNVGYIIKSIKNGRQVGPIINKYQCKENLRNANRR